MKRVFTPFIRNTDSTFTVVIDVLVAMIPAAVWSVYVFGFRALTIMAVAVLSSAIFEKLFVFAAFRKFELKDISSVVTGMLIAFALPVSVPLWLPAFATVVAVIFTKALFGGTGRNILNPAAAGICASYVLFPEQMTLFTKPFVRFPALSMYVPESLIHENRVMTTLEYLKAGTVNEANLTDDFYGLSAGSIGDISAALLLLGLAYLLFRRVTRFGKIFTFVLSYVVICSVFSFGDSEIADFLRVQMFSGSIALVAVFFMNDYVTTPSTNIGGAIYAVLLAAVIFALRYFGDVHYAEYFAVLLLCPFTQFIEKHSYPRVFGSDIVKKTV